MWRLAILASLLVTLALGGVADAKCRVCIESIWLDKGDTASTLFVDVRSELGTFPDSATAVVMQFGQNRSKCLNVGLVPTGIDGGIGHYSGAIPGGYGSAFNGVATFGGRIDLAGDVFEFAVPLDGTPGTAQLVTAATAGQIAAPVVVTPAPLVITPESDAARARAAIGLAPAATAQPAQTAGATATALPKLEPMAVLGLIAILATAFGAYTTRRRALARAGT